MRSLISGEASMISMAAIRPILFSRGMRRCEIIAVIDMATMFNVYTSTLRLDLDPQYEAIL